MITFNKPYYSGKEVDYIQSAVRQGSISGNGDFGRKCQQYLEQRYGFGKCFLTTSCTQALEMAALLCDVKQGDEVIMPSYTFVSTANAFALRGAQIVFADSRPDHPGVDEKRIESLITERTKVIVVVHYAGVACDMDKIMLLAHKYNILVVEDAAQAIDSYYLDQMKRRIPLGAIGHLSTFSFHETKNITCGEGGMLVVNDSRFLQRAEIVWEKGTNRAGFFRGEVAKYSWVDLGSSFVLSEINAAFLWAQLENLDKIQERRMAHWMAYRHALQSWATEMGIVLAGIPEYACHNAHIFYFVCPGLESRENVLKQLKERGVQAVFHYQSLHSSPYFQGGYDGPILSEADKYSDCLIRLPLFFELEPAQVIEKILEVVA